MLAISCTVLAGPCRRPAPLAGGGNAAPARVCAAHLASPWGIGPRAARDRMGGGNLFPSIAGFPCRPRPNFRGAAAASADPEGSPGGGAPPPAPPDEASVMAIAANNDPLCVANMSRCFTGESASIEVAGLVRGDEAALAVSLAVAASPSRDIESNDMVLRRKFIEYFRGMDGELINRFTIISADPAAKAACLDKVPDAVLANMRMSYQAGDMETGMQLQQVLLRRMDKFRLVIAPGGFEAEAARGGGVEDTVLLPDAQGCIDQSAERGVEVMTIAGDGDLLNLVLYVFGLFVERASSRTEPLVPGEWLPREASPLRLCLAAGDGLAAGGAAVAGGGAGAGGAGALAWGESPVAGAKFRLAYASPVPQPGGGGAGEVHEMELSGRVIEQVVDVIDQLLTDPATLADLTLAPLPPVAPPPRDLRRPLMKVASVLLGGGLLVYRLAMPYLAPAPRPAPAPGAPAAARWSEILDSRAAAAFNRRGGKAVTEPINARINPERMDALCRLVEAKAGPAPAEPTALPRPQQKKGKAGGGGAAAADAEGAEEEVVTRAVRVNAKTGKHMPDAEFQVVVDGLGSVLGVSPLNDSAVPLWDELPLRREIPGVAENAARGLAPRAEWGKDAPPEAVVLLLTVDAEGVAKARAWPMGNSK